MAWGEEPAPGLEPLCGVEGLSVHCPGEAGSAEPAEGPELRPGNPRRAPEGRRGCRGHALGLPDMGSEVRGVVREPGTGPS